MSIQDKRYVRMYLNPGSLECGAGVRFGLGSKQKRVTMITGAGDGAVGMATRYRLEDSGF
jgi:hypothetical protein